MKKNIFHYAIVLLLASSPLICGQFHEALPSNLEEAKKMLTREGGQLQTALYNLYQALTNLLPGEGEKKETSESEDAEEQEEASTPVTADEFLGKLIEIQKAGGGVINAAQDAKSIVRAVKGETWQKGLVEEPAEMIEKEDDEDIILVIQPEDSTTEEDDFVAIGTLETESAPSSANSKNE